MKVILLQHLSGAKGSFAVGEEITVDNSTALRYLKKGIATIKNPKALEAFMKKAQDIEDEEAKKKALAKSILEKDRLKVELNSLYLQVVIKESELLGIVLEDKEIVGEIEILMQRVKEEEKKEEEE